MSDLHTLQIAHTRQEANDTLYLELAVPAAAQSTFAFRAGQYLTLSADIDGTSIRRSYSICNGEQEPLAVAIKRIPGGRFSTYAHQYFRPGVALQSLPPAGHFTPAAHNDTHRRYLCIAAGSGITPILSIIKTLLAERPQAHVTLLYGNRSWDSIIFREALSWLKNAYMQRFHWINFFSQASQQPPLLSGRLNFERLQALPTGAVALDQYDEYFLCGPEGMISDIASGLRHQGVDERAINYELFFASAQDAREAMQKHAARARAYAGLTTRMAVRAGGREVNFELSADGENILDGASRAGMELPYSCRGGVCATCKAKVLEGAVDMDLNHALSAAEVAAGYILTCQSHPISDRVVVDFDVT